MVSHKLLFFRQTMSCDHANSMELYPTVFVNKCKTAVTRPIIGLEGLYNQLKGPNSKAVATLILIANVRLGLL